MHNLVRLVTAGRGTTLAFSLFTLSVPSRWQAHHNQTKLATKNNNSEQLISLSSCRKHTVVSKPI